MIIRALSQDPEHCRLTAPIIPASEPSTPYQLLRIRQIEAREYWLHHVLSVRTRCFHRPIIPAQPEQTAPPVKNHAEPSCNDPPTVADTVLPVASVQLDLDTQIQRIWAGAARLPLAVLVRANDLDAAIDVSTCVGEKVVSRSPKPLSVVIVKRQWHAVLALSWVDAN